MSIKDFNKFILGIPYYKFTPNINLYANVLSQVPIKNQIIVNSTDVRNARDGIVSEFLKRLDYDVLIFCDLDTVAHVEDLKLLALTCSETIPVLGTHIVYRGNKESNFYFKSDPKQEKKQALLYSNDIVQVDHAGFGLIAIHRSAIDKLISAYGFTNKSGTKVSNLFSEYRLKNLDSEIAMKAIKDRLKPAELSQEQWDLAFDKVKDAVQFTWQNRYPDTVLPETFSFCERCREQNIPIRVNLGIKCGHVSEEIIYPPLQEPKRHYNRKPILINGEVYY